MFVLFCHFRSKYGAKLVRNPFKKLREVFSFVLSEYGPVASHGSPDRTIFCTKSAC